MLAEQTIAKTADYLAVPRKMLIGDTWVEASSGERLDVEDPATGARIGSIPAATASDVDLAVRTARAAFESRVWRGMPREQRAAVLWKLSDLLLANIEEFARLEVLDNGMTGAFARATATSAATGLRYYAGMCTKIHGRTSDIGNDLQFHAFSVAEPVGVAALIVPWNGPIVTACTKMAPALAAGCSVILKPAEQTSLTALRLGELILEAGIPPGVVNIITGLGPTTGQALVSHPGVDKVSFTGSTAVGKSIVATAAKDLKRVTLELGGKSPVFVFDDADLTTAIPAAAMGIFANSGQVCYAGSRLYVQAKVYDRVVAGLEQAAKNIKLGSGLEQSTNLGPLISARQRRRVLEYIGSGVEQGAELVTGGSAHGGAGYFVEPTIFANGRPDMRIVQEEIFGPVLTVMRFTDIGDVGRLGNATSYGLGAGVYTTNLSNAHKAVRLLDAGNIWVNCYGRTDKSLPFGGFKQSGWGRENGFEGVEAFLERKAVYMHL
jgi:acyl-CoA reductase-like NAD-dependent aldehyde dehydrogenase